MNPLRIPPDRLEQLRAICLALPGATEKDAWGDPTWRVRDRIFGMHKATTTADASVWLKALAGAPEVLLCRGPVPPWSVSSDG